MANHWLVILVAALVVGHIMVNALAVVKLLASAVLLLALIDRLADTGMTPALGAALEQLLLRLLDAEDGPPTHALVRTPSARHNRPRSRRDQSGTHMAVRDASVCSKSMSTASAALRSSRPAHEAVQRPSLPATRKSSKSIRSTPARNPWEARPAAPSSWFWEDLQPRNVRQLVPPLMPTRVHIWIRLLRSTSTAGKNGVHLTLYLTKSGNVTSRSEVEAIDDCVTDLARHQCTTIEIAARRKDIARCAASFATVRLQFELDAEGQFAMRGKIVDATSTTVVNLCGENGTYSSLCTYTPAVLPRCSAPPVGIHTRIVDPRDVDAVTYDYSVDRPNHLAAMWTLADRKTLSIPPVTEPRACFLPLTPAVIGRQLNDFDVPLSRTNSTNRGPTAPPPVYSSPGLY